MPLSASERATLLAWASLQTAEPPAIHRLAGMYRHFGAHDAVEVTTVIAEATCNSGIGAYTESHFSGFITEGSSDTRGFRPELTDPEPSNPQTGHFFSYVVWALNGISDFEYAAAIGHELYPDWADPLHLEQITRGRRHSEALREVVMAQPHSPDATLDYAAMDAALDRHGWNEATLRPWETWVPRISFEHGVQAQDINTGNSLQDLRCTVAGLVFGNTIRIGNFRNAERASQWLARNVIEGGVISPAAVPPTVSP